jgi:hypothetical protein
MAAPAQYGTGTVGRAAASPPVRHYPPEGDDVGTAIGHARSTRKGVSTVRRKLVQSLTYEITFAGQAGAVLRAEFDDCEISVGPGTTTLRAVLPDQNALHGLLQRLASFRLELIHLRLVAPPRE